MAELARWLEPDASGNLTRFIWFCETTEPELRDLSALTKWPQLQELVLEGHDLSNLSVWPHLPALRYVSLRNCQLQTLPASLPADRWHLIDLSSNQLADVEVLANAPSLDELHLAHNPLTCLPQGAVWPRLHTLNLTATPDRLSLQLLAHLSGLRVLYVKQRCLGADTPVLPQVEQLYASMEGKIPRLDFSDWQNLQTLHLHVKNWVDLSQLQLPAGIKELTLTHGPQLSVPPDLSKLNQLQRLSLHYLALRDFSFIHRSASLRRVSIKGCPVKADELRSHFPTLEVSE